jgi:hypothetical protein
MKKSTSVIRKKKIGPPFKIGKKKAAEPFALRLSEEITADLKAYAKEEGIKHKGEAIRRLIEEALQKRKAP